MSHSFELSDSVFALLAQEARRTRLSTNQLAEQLLVERLGSERETWQAALDSLRVRVHARMSTFDSGEIGDDITVAAEEVTRERHARRRPA